MDFQPLLNTHHDDRGQDVCEKVFESPGLQNSGSSLSEHLRASGQFGRKFTE